MDRKSVLVIILIGMFCNSCCLPILQDMQKNYNKGFKLKKKQSENEIDRIDFSVVYIGRGSSLRRMGNGNMEEIETYPFYRFFRDGQYQYGFLNHIDNNQDVINLKKITNLKKATAVSKGYFIVKGEYIYVEFFSFNPHNCGKFIIHKNEMINDSIVGFKKMKLDTLTGEIDW